MLESPLNCFFCPYILMEKRENGRQADRKKMLDVPTISWDQLKKTGAELVRDDHWLKHYLDYLWGRHFGDIGRVNQIDLAFGYPWKIRLGLIMQIEEGKRFTSAIRLNSLMRLEVVPEIIITITLAHELIHYAHGFGSPLSRRYPHPHRGDVVNKELRARRLGEYLGSYHQWLDEAWFPIHERYSGIFC